MNSSAQIEINLNILENNTKKILEKYNDYKYKFVDLRNNAYGLGVYCVNKLYEIGINYVYVSHLNEALEIRKYNQEINVLVGQQIDLKYIYDAINQNITITITNINYLQELVNMELRDILRVHLLVDNGSNKLGLSTVDEVLFAKELIKSNTKIKLEGIYTNITSYGIDDPYFYTQANEFLRIVQEMDQDLMIHVNEPMMYHIKNEMINGIRFDLSLFGLAQQCDDIFINNKKKKSIDKKYGINAFQALDIDLDLVFSITANVIDIKMAYVGELIGRNYIVKNEDIRLGIIDIGHKDGITKAIKELVINDSVCEVIADDLDYLYVKINDDVEINDKAYLISNYNYIDNVLTNLNTNRYYLMSIINSGLRRIYIDEDGFNEESY